MIYTFGKVVSKGYRESLKSRYPEIFQDERKVRFLYFILFSLQKNRQENPERNDVIAYHYVRENILGVKDTSFSLIGFLGQFQNCIDFPLNITDFSRHRGLAREFNPSLPDEITQGLIRELEIPRHKKEKPVYFLTGKTPDSKKESKRRKTEKESYYQDAKESIILEYFRNMNHTVYNPYYENIERVRQDLIDNRDRFRENQYLTYLLHLDSLSDNLVPMYFENSQQERVWASGYSLQNLKAEYRMDILKGCIAADLVSCHLSIAAYDWNVPRLKELLESGENVWKYFHEQLEIPFNPVTKAAFKIGIYSVLYGGGEKKIVLEIVKKALDEKVLSALVPASVSDTLTGLAPSDLERAVGQMVKDGQDMGLIDRFLALPLVQDLRAAAKAQRDTATANKFVYLADGTKLYGI